MTGSPVVIDAGVVINEQVPNPDQERYQELMSDLSDHELTVPTLWTYETTSALSKLVHFGHLSPERGREALNLIAKIKLRQVDPDEIMNQSAFEWTLKLGRAAAYDSYYLALAESLGCDLWTADRKLVRQVDLPWVRWAGQYP